MQRYLIDAGPELSGFRPPSLLLQNPHTVLRHDEMVHPNYYRSEGYNEFFRLMGMHHGLLTLLRDDRGRFVGYYPVFRSEHMKPFTRDDVDFLKAAAIHVAHGVIIANSTGTWYTDGEEFEAFNHFPQGIVIMNREGKVLSLNETAYSIFKQFAIYDNWGSRVSTNDELRTQLGYVAKVLHDIFGDNQQIAAEACTPITKIYAHRAGATLRLRGFVSNLIGGHFTVLIELGETETLLRYRLTARYGLSRRQTEILMLLRHDTTTREMASRLQIGASALKSSLRELRLKLDLPDLASLREFAHGHSSDLNGHRTKQKGN
ncbi:MAG: hypothetical protein JO166_15720 [Deltaproteobacteria bacterium]|nr:hypothetical protein [Deltaproteobacteria bacterium]